MIVVDVDAELSSVLANVTDGALIGLCKRHGFLMGYEVIFFYVIM